MPRGGRRSGKPGKAYGNRVDLNSAPTGLPYGERKAREQQVAAMPLPSGGQGSGAAPVAPPATASRPAPVPFAAPTQNPDQPLTEGLAGGPGAGPEVMSKPADPLVGAAALLNALGDTADADTKRLRAQVNAAVNNLGAA